jgi:hypothetical protein
MNIIFYTHFLFLLLAFTRVTASMHNYFTRQTTENGLYTQREFFSIYSFRFKKSNRRA